MGITKGEESEYYTDPLPFSESFVLPPADTRISSFSSKHGFD